jgi:nuclear control of ATPase protein 2
MRTFCFTEHHASDIAGAIAIILKTLIPMNFSVCIVTDLMQLIWIWVLISSQVSIGWGWKLNFSRKDRDQAGSFSDDSIVDVGAPKFEGLQLGDCPLTMNSGFEASRCSSLSDSELHLLPGRIAARSLSMIFGYMQRILFYKPPVGAVAVISIARLLLSGRLFPLRDRHTKRHNVEDTLFLQQQRSMAEVRRGRSLIIDADDTCYVTYGGIEHVRRKLCIAALSSPNMISGTESLGFFQSARKALEVTLRPSGSFTQYIHDVTNTLASTKAGKRAVSSPPPKSASDSTGPTSDPIGQWNITSHERDLLASSVSTTLQVCLTDAVLRLCRDRVLQTAYRLARTVEYWERRIEYSQTINRWFRNIFTKSIENDRTCLSLAKAAFRMEVTRLGEITSILWQRPPEASEIALVRARKTTEGRAGTVYVMSSDSAGVNSDPVPLPMRNWASRIFAFCTNYTIRWKADGKGFLSIRKFCEEDTYIDVPSAVDTLIGRGSDRSFSDSKVEWETSARTWIREGRRGIQTLIEHSLRSSTVDSVVSTFPQKNLTFLDENWHLDLEERDIGDDQVWSSVIHYANSLASWRRVGEGAKIRLRDVFGINDWAGYLDWFGIPITFFYIYMAGQFHERFVVLYWQRIREEVINVATKSAEIIQQRVWLPLKEIYDDIMNKAPTLMSALGLEAEENSLDQMLRDLNFGDGTPARRQEALQKATKQYEQDLSQGLFTNLVRGRLVRLLLIQVQQLKVGMLSALDTIDLLLKGNRIHFKILAAIPTLLVVTYGTRYFLRALYNIRAKDLRPVRAVHAEMSQYLSKTESILLLSREEEKIEDAELGELILNMHRYLILLDFCSPLFGRHCDHLHNSLQKLTGSSGAIKCLGRERQLRWVSRIKQEHQGLAKYL